MATSRKRAPRRRTTIGPPKKGIYRGGFPVDLSGTWKKQYAKAPGLGTADIRFYVGNFEGVEIEALFHNVGNMTKAARKLGGRKVGSLDWEMRREMLKLVRRTLVPSVQKHTPIQPPQKNPNTGHVYWPGGKLVKSVKGEGTASKPRLRVGKFRYTRPTIYVPAISKEYWYVWPVTRGRDKGNYVTPANKFIYRGVRAGMGGWREGLQKYVTEYSQKIFDQYGKRGFH